MCFEKLSQNMPFAHKYSKNQGRVVIVVVVVVVDSIPTAYPGCLTLLSAPGGNPSVLYYLVGNDNQDVLPLCDLKLLFDSC